MQTTPALLRDLTTLFRDQLFIEVPSVETDLLESGLLDSLQLVKLLLHIEQDLGYRIPLDEISLDDLRSLERIARVITARQFQAAA
jgi:acyl carrier protein